MIRNDPRLLCSGRQACRTDQFHGNDFPQVLPYPGTDAAYTRHRHINDVVGKKGNSFRFSILEGHEYIDAPNLRVFGAGIANQNDAISLLRYP